ncbi:MAG: GTPase domain-containing protein [candidate division Zixibacteria bacterium]|nr:GTPase domain-containing protein [candidate division Zixibacteria bacterium]
MVSINYSAREVCCKIVYYGPGLSGKTTNLQYVHSKVPNNTRGDLISLATEADRTLYFDFLPINIGTINGFTAKFQLYTVPGQVYYNATRKLVLRGVDGIVFVADSQPEKMDENIESITNLEENLKEYGYDINNIPVVLQFNKRDLPGVLPVEELNARLNKCNWPTFEASASIGNGVFDTLKKIIKIVLDKAKSSSAPKIRSAPAASGPTPPPDVQAMSPEKSELVREPALPPSATGEVRSSTGKIIVTEAAYRPYPGSEKEAQREKKISSVALASSKDDELAAASLEKNVIAHDNKTEESPIRMHTPQMAPSLKRRGEGKKRGFFKRLFGIK